MKACIPSAEEILRKEIRISVPAERRGLYDQEIVDLSDAFKNAMARVLSDNPLPTTIQTLDTKIDRQANEFIDGNMLPEIEGPTLRKLYGTAWERVKSVAKLPTVAAVYVH